MRNTNKKTIELTGVFQMERFAFQDGTPQRVIIGQLDDGTTIKGECQPDDLKPSILYRFDGEWRTHPKFGRQFLFHSFCQPAPKNRESLEGYLGTCPGIGPMRARKVFDLYGMDALAIIKESPERLANDVRGITLDIAKAVQSNLIEREAKEGFTLELKSLLGGKGFPKKIYGQLEADFGTKAPELIRDNPFLLLKYKGVGFERADQVYHDLGKDRTALIRQVYYIRWLVDCDRTGSVWIDEKSIQSQLQKEIGDLAKYHDAIQEAVNLEILTRRNGCLADPSSASAEAFCVATIYTMLDRPNCWPSELITDTDATPTEHQLSEYQKAIAGPVATLIGSPGTGKTWLVARMIRTLQKTGKSIAVCAPTGKAALRVVESLATQGVSATASTIHSLLQAETDDGGWWFKHNAANPLPFDFLIIDESSMIDIRLLRSLLSAVDSHTNVMFVGDPDQLPPVGVGAPLRDVIAAGLPCGKLTEIRRNAGAIVEACAAIRQNERFNVHVHELPSVGCPSPRGDNLVVLNTPQSIDAMMKRIIEIETFEQSQTPDFSPIRDMQILVAVNDRSPLARKALNTVLQNHYNPSNGRENETKIKNFRPTDKIICLTNGTAALAAQERGGVSPPVPATVRIANGDIGYLEDTLKSNLLVDVNGNMIFVPMYSDLWGERDWDLGYAISCHKSQGSEWPVVVAVLDSSFGAMSICDRHWIYTAISRASHRCYLLGNESTIWAMTRKSNMGTRKTFFVEDFVNLRWQFLDDRFANILNEN